VVFVNYGPDFLREDLLRRLFDIYHENNEFIDFICSLDIQLSQDKIIRDYILDVDNNYLPKELENKFIEKCLDQENFDVLNKYFARDEQGNIDIVIKILNSGYENAFTYVKDQRNLHDIIRDIYKRFDDIEDKDVKCKVIEYFAQIQKEKYEKRYQDKVGNHKEMCQDLRIKCNEIIKVLHIAVKEIGKTDGIMLRKFQDLKMQVGDFRTENSKLLESNNKLLNEKSSDDQIYNKLRALYRNAAGSLVKTREDLAESKRRNEAALRLGLKWVVLLISGKKALH
jgi:hypothetical protein